MSTDAKNGYASHNFGGLEGQTIITRGTTQVWPTVEVVPLPNIEGGAHVIHPGDLRDLVKNPTEHMLDQHRFRRDAIREQMEQLQKELELLDRILQVIE